MYELKSIMHQFSVTIETQKCEQPSDISCSWDYWLIMLMEKFN